MSFLSPDKNNKYLSTYHKSAKILLPLTIASYFSNKYNLEPQSIKEEELFNKKIFKRSKGSLKLLNVGKLEKSTNLEISYASKKAKEVIEKLGGKIKLTKK